MSDPIIADAIKALRLERAWSQEQLAEIAGVSVRTVQRLEQGHKASLETSKAMAAAFDLSVDDLRQRSRQPTGTEPMTALPDSVPHGGLRRHLVIYAIVIGVLAAINLATSPTHLWFVYPMLGWGAALVLKGLKLRRST